MESWTVRRCTGHYGGMVEWTKKEKMEKNSGRIGKSYKEIAKKTKAKSLIERICEYKEWAKTVKEVGEYLNKSAIVW